LWRRPTTFPSSALFGHPLSSARFLAREETRVGLTDRPRPSLSTPPREGRRRPEDRDAFHRCIEGRWRNGSTISVRRSPRSRRPRTPKGRAWMGIARSRCGHPRVRDVFKETSAFFSRSVRLELTSQAHVRGRPARPSTRTDCLARIAPLAAPQRLLRPRATGSDLSLGEHFCIARDTPHPHVAGRRLPPCPLFLASHGHRLGSRSPYQEPSPISPAAPTACRCVVSGTISLP
jgi:hypothetical protein